MKIQKKMFLLLLLFFCCFFFWAGSWGFGLGVRVDVNGELKFM